MKTDENGNKLISYEFNEETGECFTTCPFLSFEESSYGPKVGSMSCHECTSFVADDENKKIISCSYKRC